MPRGRSDRVVLYRHLLYVLDVYPTQPDPDAIAASLGLSVQTVRRYVRDLREAGARLDGAAIEVRS
ncbi:MAG TPA: HTH domain-containing protein [Gammaproteobacteria bacterium]|nr:HTH domain-containing protein [Gammaproteobacteria bacterium]